MSNFVLSNQAIFQKKIEAYPHSELIFDNWLCYVYYRSEILSLIYKGLPNVANETISSTSYLALFMPLQSLQCKTDLANAFCSEQQTKRVIQAVVQILMKYCN